MTATTDTESLLDAARAKMAAAAQADAAIRPFLSALRRVHEGAATLMPSSELEPASGVPELDELRACPDGADVLGRLAIIKLNGGLATSMGLRQPKSLIEAREGRTFLDIIVAQTLAFRLRHGVGLPLLLMHSDATRTASLEALEAYPDLPVTGIALDFVQSMVPKLDAATLAPVSWPASPASSGAPPGTGTSTPRSVGRACSRRCAAAATATR